MRQHALFLFSFIPLAALTVSAGPLDELMPVPVAVEARAGFAKASVLCASLALAPTLRRRSAALPREHSAETSKAMPSVPPTM